jgi:antitoxin ParD1/3/4
MTHKISISLTDTHASAIQAAVESGEYASASEVIREALRAWNHHRKLKALIEEGIDSLEQEGGVELDVEALLDAWNAEHDTEQSKAA